MRELSAGTTPKKWVLEWALVAASFAILGGSLALLVTSFVVPPLTSAQVAVERSRLERDFQAHLDSEGIALNVHDPFPGDSAFPKYQHAFWEAQRFRVRAAIRKAGLEGLLLTLLVALAAATLRARRTRTAGHRRLLARIAGIPEDRLWELGQ